MIFWWRARRRALFFARRPTRPPLASAHAPPRAGRFHIRRATRDARALITIDNASARFAGAERAQQSGHRAKPSSQICFAAEQPLSRRAWQRSRQAPDQQSRLWPSLSILLSRDVAPVCGLLGAGARRTRPRARRQAVGAAARQRIRRGVAMHRYVLRRACPVVGGAGACWRALQMAGATVGRSRGWPSLLSQLNLVLVRSSRR